MFAPLAPILAADADASAETQGITARVEALAPVMATVARLAGCPLKPATDPLALGADLSGLLVALSPELRRIVAYDLETLGVVLQAGIMALDKARAEGRFSHAAARLLHTESDEAYRQILADAGYPPLL
ncbi:hypothetical protein [Blastomonas sp.]|uniref:hypothetical protein n=1 Tax=Blastomonas sp. TaxID=1909299 RepID=UPI002638EE26|nr:hypothetical protein [Blastomonas sp.]MDM7955950.1 hypothetical protein [Blastomonas sp.]